MSISSYGSCAHLISGGGISFTAICTIKEALAIELALNIAAGTAEAQTKTSTNKPSGEICPRCGGEVLINKPSGNGFCLQCEYTITGKLSRSVG
jgi:hypothetical protein